MADELTGKPIVRGDGQWSQTWAKADRRYWIQSCSNKGECYYCGEIGGKHEDGCRNEQDEEVGDE
jgi:hypothetical protein